MALQIQTTGLDQYAPGGKARLKVMLIGGPGAGKTRYSSYWPKPIYADCEGGLTSVADRKVPFVNISTSKDMLDLLVYLKQECARPESDRKFNTVVIDTLDAFQRKVKDEWLQANNAQSFRGFEAWGYLDAKMQMLLTRLLNLDMNVIVAVHYKDKTIKEGVGENAAERQELMLQLSGEVKDSVFNDFDLVGWVGTYWVAEEGQRVEKRGLTFKRTPDKPFLKDRLHVTPSWMEINFADTDYSKLLDAVQSRVEELEQTEDYGTIPDAIEGPTIPTPGVIGSLAGGALPPQDAREIPLHQNDKTKLQAIVRDLRAEAERKGLTDVAATLTYKGNTLKGELIALIESARPQVEAAPEPGKPDAEPATEAPATDAAPAEQPTEAPAEQPAPETDAAPASEPAAQEVPAEPVATEPEPAPVVEAPAEPAPADPTPEPAASTPVEAPAPQVETPAAPAASTPVLTGEGQVVDTTTGEILETADPIEVIKDKLDAEVISETPVAETAPAPTPAPTAPATAPAAPAQAPEGTNCDECGRSLADQNPNYVKLGHIKWRKHLCDEHFLAAKNGS